jgi:hypothetical protein
MSGTVASRVGHIVVIVGQEQRMSVMSGTELKRRVGVGQDVGHESDTVEFVSVLWMTKAQAALHFNVSPRTIERRAKAEAWERDTSQRPMRYGILADVADVSGTNDSRFGHAVDVVDDMSDTVANVPDSADVGVGHGSGSVGHGGGPVSGTISISLTREAELLGRVAEMSDTVERLVGQLDRQMSVCARQVSVIQDTLSDRDSMLSVIASQQRMIETKDAELRALRPAPEPAAGVTIRGATRRRWWRFGRQQPRIRVAH